MSSVMSCSAGTSTVLLNCRSVAYTVTRARPGGTPANAYAPCSSARALKNMELDRRLMYVRQSCSDSENNIVPALILAQHDLLPRTARDRVGRNHVASGCQVVEGELTRIRGLIGVASETSTHRDPPFDRLTRSRLHDACN